MCTLWDCRACTRVHGGRFKESISLGANILCLGGRYRREFGAVRGGSVDIGREGSGAVHRPHYRKTSHTTRAHGLVSGERQSDTHLNFFESLACPPPPCWRRRAALWSAGSGRMMPPQAPIRPWPHRPQRHHQQQQHSGELMRGRSAMPHHPQHRAGEAREGACRRKQVCPSSHPSHLTMVDPHPWACKQGI